MKKSKVTKLTKFDKKPGFKETSYSVEFENGDKGFYNTMEEDQKRFSIGQECEYDIEQKEGKEGKKYFKVTHPNDAKPAWQAGGNKKPQIEPRIQMISFAAAYTKDLVVAGKVGIQDFKKEFENIYNVMTAKI